MSKMIVELGLYSLVFDTPDAVKFVDLLSHAECYREKWRDKESGGTSYHIYPMDRETSRVALKFITDDEYKVMKLAGKPEE